MDAVEIKANNQCVKVLLPGGEVVDILSSVLNEIAKWIQDNEVKPESGGFIAGYQHKGTGNVSLEMVSVPRSFDVKSRVRFEIKDPAHKLFLVKAKRKQSYYMGAWHTHPQKVPIPSPIDWEDWHQSMHWDKTGCRYIFFIIAGTEEWKIWIGDFSTGEISEGAECPKDSEGLYVERSSC